MYMRKVFALSVCCLFVWQQLSAQKLPPVYLNHVYTVLDSITYTAIQSSTFLKDEFANFTEETKVSNNGKTWTGLYLYGEKTYIEFFQAGKFPQFKSNESGMGFGVEKKGGVNLYYQRLKKIFDKQAETGLVTRFEKGVDIPWFYDTGVNYHDNDQTFFDWLMEYEPTYLQRMYADLKPEENGITRKQNLSRDFKKEGLFGNITEVNIALDSKEKERLVKELQAFNYKISKVKSKIIANGPEVKFIIVDNSMTNGITSLKIALTRKMEGRTVYKFGANSVLELKGETAHWIF
jgi:hypothetical protein